MRRARKQRAAEPHVSDARLAFCTSPQPVCRTRSTAVTYSHGGRCAFGGASEQGAFSLHLRSRVLQHGGHGRSRYRKLYTGSDRNAQRSQTSTRYKISERASSGRPVGTSPGSSSCSCRRVGQHAIGDERAATASRHPHDSHAGGEPRNAEERLHSSVGAPVTAQKIQRLPGRAKQHGLLPGGRRRGVLQAAVVQFHVKR
jgi:hypothetical protein